MKKIKIAIALTFLAAFFLTPQAQSQAVVAHGYYSTFDSGTKVYETEMSHDLRNPGGNFVRIYFVQLDLNDPLVPEKKPVRIIFRYWEILINPDGRAMLKRLHNGR